MTVTTASPNVPILNASPVTFESSRSTQQSLQMNAVISDTTIVAGDIDTTVVRTDSAASIDPRFVLPKCEVPPRKDFEPIENFVCKAVQEQHQMKDDTQPLKSYRGIIEALRFKTDVPLLTQILLAMRTNRNTIHWLTHVSNQHARLIHQIVRFDPFLLPPSPRSSNADNPNKQALPPPLTANTADHDYRLADAHLSLLVALVSANSVFLVPAVTALWKLLARPPRLPAATATATAGRAAPEEMTRRLHAAVATMLRLCPKGKMEIFSILAAHAPFRSRSHTELSWYYKQCLYVLEYVPGIEGQVLEMLIDKCLEMDVEIKIKDGGEVLIDKEQEDDVADEVFQLDLDDDEDNEKKTKAKAKLPESSTVDEMADKLDLLMLQLFEYMEYRIRVDPSHAYSLYHVLSRSFESSILITHKSKFVQFLILHLCGLEAAQDGNNEDPLYRDFAAKLINVLLDPYRATSTRQAAACYLASFVSRATYVCSETICEAVAALLRWAEAYMESLGRYAVHAADARNQSALHSLFYTVSQAAFYIICFRGVEAVQYFREKAVDYDEPAQIDLSPERWTRLGAHGLQPLRYCLESVRSEFLAVSKAVQLVEVDILEALIAEEKRLATTPLVRRKKRVSKIRTAVTIEKERRTGGVGGLGQGTNPLDSFFPFDPYLLHRSYKFVEPFYCHWKGPVELDDEMLMEDEAMEEMDEESVGSTDKLLEEDNDNDNDDDNSSSSSSRSSVSGDDEMRHQFEGDPMSFGSQGAPGLLRMSEPSSAETIETKRQELHDAWSAEHKRARAPSVENGSW